MTLFLRTQNRLFEISDAYVMALSFLIFFAVGKIVKAVVEKQKQKRKQKRKNTKNINMANPIGGNLGLEISDDTELANTILTCIADNERYLVKDPEIIKMVFNLVKAKIKNESLVLTPNMMRFLALKLINNDQTLTVKIGNILASSNNRARLFARVSGSALIGFVGALFSMFPYAVLMAIFYFTATENCCYKCSDYFETLPNEGPVEIYKKESNGHVLIAGNDGAKQIEIYTPLKSADEVAVSSNGVVKRTTSYTKARKKAKQVNFSDFKNTDPVLSSFKDLEEPEIPQKNCPVSDVHDIINIRVE